MAKVYVLGAGASRALNNGAPLMAELLKKALEFSLDISTGTEAVPSAREVKNFLVDVYSMTDTLSPDSLVPPFEDVLSLLDERIGSNMPLSRMYSVDDLRQLRKKLVYIMGRVLQVNMAQRTNGHLVKTFLNSLSPEDSIISLNYDLIIENGVLNRGGVVNYHIPVSSNLRLYRDETAPETKIYKLHGSLNWLYCPVCLVIETSDGRKQALETLIQDKRCEKCKTCLEPILVTPSFLKDYNNSFIAELWRKAQQQLQQANKIVFVGYSMPDADIVLRMFYTRAIFSNKEIRGQRCQITVIDKNQSEQNELRTRYERLFGVVDYYKDGFDGYIDTKLTPN